MPTPVGHALAGLAVAGLFNGSPRPRPSHVAILVCCALAPDLDLLLRLADGVNHHRAASHSLVAAALVGAIGSLLRWRGFDLPGGPSIAAAWASHIVLDYFGRDNSPPIGLMALWPFSSGFFASSVSVFQDVPRSFSAAAIRHNAAAVLLELAILSPAALVCWRRLLLRKAHP